MIVWIVSYITLDGSHYTLHTKSYNIILDAMHLIWLIWLELDSIMLNQGVLSQRLHQKADYKRVRTLQNFQSSSSVQVVRSDFTVKWVEVWLLHTTYIAMQCNNDTEQFRKQTQCLCRLTPQSDTFCGKKPSTINIVLHFVKNTFPPFCYCCMHEM